MQIIQMLIKFIGCYIEQKKNNENHQILKILIKLSMIEFNEYDVLIKFSNNQH